MSKQNTNHERTHEELLKSLEARAQEHDQESKRIRTFIKEFRRFFPSGSMRMSVTVVPHVQVFIAPNEFESLPLLKAVEAYLEKEGTPQRYEAMADALKRGGYASNSENLAALIKPALYRHVRKARASNTSPRFVKRDAGWGLASWT